MADIDLNNSNHTPPDEILKPDVDILAMLGADDDTPAVLTGSDVGVVKFDAAAKKVQFPYFKVRQDGSEARDPNIPCGAFTLNLETQVSQEQGPNKIQQCLVTFLQFWSGYRDKANQGYKGPRNRYNTLQEIATYPKTALGVPPTLRLRASDVPKGLEHLMCPKGIDPTVEEYGEVALLIEQPAGVNSPVAFPYEFNGKRFALAKWFLSGWAVWNVTRAVRNAEVVWRPVTIMGVKWRVWTVVAKGGNDKTFYKVDARLEPNTVNDAAFVRWIAELAGKVKKQHADAEDDAKRAEG